MNIGFIYCLSNPAMPGLYKIGMTERSPSMRCWELSSSTAAPLEFDIEFYAEVANVLMVERQLHAALDRYRVNPGREFFRCLPGVAYNWLMCNVDILTECIRTDVSAQLEQAMQEALAAQAQQKVIEVDF